MQPATASAGESPTRSTSPADVYDLSQDPVAWEILRNSTGQEASSGGQLKTALDVPRSDSARKPAIDRRASDLIDDMLAASAVSNISPPSSSHSVNPATIPIRTSSSQAFLGEAGGSPNRKSSVKKHRRLGSVPEERRFPGRAIVDERNWLSQGRGSMNGARSQRSPTPTSSSPEHRRLASQLSMEILKPVNAGMIEGDGVHWSAEKENILKGPFEYLELHPGKDIRAELINAFNEWLRVPQESLTVINKAVGMLHTASLLIDDVEDSSTLRRGIPVAHSIFGTAQTINSANYIYFCALQELMKLNNPECVQIYTEELLNLHRGQGMDLFWRDTLTCPSEDDYLEMVGNKTGGLFRLAIKLMCAESPSHHYGDLLKAKNPEEPRQQTDFVPLVNTIGLLFQILDDYKNLSDTTYTANKGLCEDLTEGKFSFPIIHAIRSDPGNLQLINILKQKTQDDDVKRYAVAYMEKTGSFSYTRRVLRGLTKKAFILVDEVDAGQGKADRIKAFLEKLRVDKHGREQRSGDYGNLTTAGSPTFVS